MTQLVVPANIDKYERIYRQGYDKKYPNLDLVRLEGWYFGKKPGRLLDYGAGTGVNALHMAECGYGVIAVDAAKESVALMKSKLKNMAAAQWVSPDATELPFENDGFDYIVCMSVLSLLETKERISTLVGEFFRVLKPGGGLKMFEHTGSRIFPFNLILNLMNPLCRNVGPEVNRDTPANVLAAGFSVGKVTNIFLDVVKTIEALAPKT